jgi:hypothetical protein
MSDLKQLSYWLASDGWHDLRDSAPMFAGGYFINAACNPGSNGNFSLMTLTTPRPSALAIWASGTYNYPANLSQNAAQSITFDGIPSLMGSFQEEIKFSGDSAKSSGTASANATSMTMIPSISAGQHKIGMRVQVSSDYNTPVTLLGVKIMALIAVYASGNSL